jgi:hypothetical protein
MDALVHWLPNIVLVVAALTFAVIVCTDRWHGGIDE